MRNLKNNSDWDIFSKLVVFHIVSMLLVDHISLAFPFLTCAQNFAKQVFICVSIDHYTIACNLFMHQH